ncbi:hypothetical protein AVEN_65205-1 [Araneus ventricosus]|uniref:Uncharacterized protein n=1 Tax=Araneus ventricosus TaxID=182803 RepID=A0A4Y2AFQ3_ARAVE|nr:hypothetical protein AVEN_65205-1 [Araneus ventricosus]
MPSSNFRATPFRECLMLDLRFKVKQAHRHGRSLINRVPTAWPVFRRIWSAFRFITRRGNRKNRCCSGDCGVVISRWLLVNDRTLKACESMDDKLQHGCREICQAICVGTVQLVGIPPTKVHKYEPRATRRLPSHTPWQQGFRIGFRVWTPLVLKPRSYQ